VTGFSGIQTSFFQTRVKHANHVPIKNQNKVKYEVLDIPQMIHSISSGKKTLMQWSKLIRLKHVFFTVVSLVAVLNKVDSERGKAEIPRQQFPRNILVTSSMTCLTSS